MRDHAIQRTALLLCLASVALPALALAQSVSVSVQNLTPGTTVSVGTTVTFNVVAAGFTNPTYALTDSLSGSTVTNSAINSSGLFTWTPQSADQGVHNITVSISDSQGHVASIAVQITVASSYITLGTVSPSASVQAGTTVNFSTSVTGFSNPSFAVSDSFKGTSINSTDINSGGFFSWTPGAGDVGTHNITVLAFDSSGHSAHATATIVVNIGTNVSISPVSPSTTVSPGRLVVFNATANNFNNPAFTVTDSFSGTTVQSGDISTSGDFTWTPAASDIGTHTINITAYDTAGHTGSAQVVMTISSSAASPTTAAPTSVATAAPATVSGPATTVFTFTQFLTQGDSGDEVTHLQQLLFDQGFLSVSPTGHFGPATAAAVSKFQTAHGITAAGYVGPSTREALNTSQGSSAAAAPSAAPTVGGSYAVSPQLKQEVLSLELLIQQMLAILQKISLGQ